MAASAPGNRRPSPAAESSSPKLMHPFISSAAMTTLLHPVTYGKVLIQLGYEPLAPTKGHTLFSLMGFGKKQYYLPSILGICGYIRNQRGTVHLFTTGLAAEIFINYIQGAVYSKLIQGLESSPSRSTKKRPPPAFIQEVFNMMLARTVCDVVSQPLFVVMVRQMANIAETKPIYTGFFGTISRIWNEEGLPGFFAGLVPRLLGDLATVFLARLLVRIFARLLDTLLSANEENQNTDAERMAGSIAQLLSTSITYPFSVVATVMTCGNTRLRVAPPKFHGWIECWKALKADGEWKRGGSLFFRMLNKQQLAKRNLSIN